MRRKSQKCQRLIRSEAETSLHLSSCRTAGAQRLSSDSFYFATIRQRFVSLRRCGDCFGGLSAHDGDVDNYSAERHRTSVIRANAVPYG